MHVNRGYRWDEGYEAEKHVTLGEDGWSTESVWKQATAKTAIPRDKAFNLLNQRDAKCENEILQEVDVFHAGQVDVSVPPAFAGLPMSAASFADFNADGLVDVVFGALTSDHSPIQEGWALNQAIFLNTGRGFTNVIRRPSTPVQPQEGGSISDAPAWCGIPSDFYSTQFLRSRGTTFGTQDRARLVDLDNDGLLDVVYRGDCSRLAGTAPCTARAKWRRNLRKVPDMLTSVSSTGGASTAIDYVAGTSDKALQDGTTIAGSLGNLPIGQQVVSEIRSFTQGTGGVWQNFAARDGQRIRMSYENFVREEGGASAVGFEKVTAKFYNSVDGVEQPAVATTTVYDVRPTVAGAPLKHPLRGTVVSIETADSATNDSVRTTTQYRVETLDGGVRIRTQALVNTTSMDTLSIHSATEYRDFDALGFPKTVLTGRSLDGLTVASNHPENTIASTVYAHRMGEWRIGRPASVQVVEASNPSRILSLETLTYRSDGRPETHSKLVDVGSECTDNAQQQQTTKANSYNAFGLPTEILENGARTKSLAYDAYNLNVARSWTVIPKSPSSRGATLEQLTTYDLRFGALRSKQNANDDVYGTTYDSLGRVLSSTVPGSQVVATNVYADPASGLGTVTTTTFTDPGQSYVTKSYFDGAGRTLATIVQHTGGSAPTYVRSTHRHYDGFGRLTASFQPRFVSSTAIEQARVEPSEAALRTIYDGFDRSVSETRPDGKVSTHDYSVRNIANTAYLSTLTSNARNYLTRRSYDAQGRLVALEHLGTNSKNTPLAQYYYTRDGLGRILTIRDGDASSRRVAYDAGGRVVLATLASTTDEELPQHFCYDADDRLIHVQTPNGREVIIERDILGRETRLEADFIGTSTNGSATADPTVASFGYDCAIEENSLGRLCTVDDASGSSYITYDNLGRRLLVDLYIDNGADTQPGATRHRVIQQFGLGGQLKRMTFSGDRVREHRIDYTHDIHGRTSSVTARDPRTPPLSLVKATAYDEFGRAISATLGNDVVEAWQYHKLSGYLTSTALKQGNTAFTELRYPLASYDAHGNMQREERYVGATLKSAKTHTFDALDRLSSSRLEIEGRVLSETMLYSPGGNILRSNDLAYAYADPANSQAVTSVGLGTDEPRSLTYDDDGWLNSDETTGAGGAVRRVPTFDAFGCMRSVETFQDDVNAQSTTQTSKTINVCGIDGQRVYRESHVGAKTERVYFLPNGAEIRPDQGVFVAKLPVGTATVAHLAWSLNDGHLVSEESGYVHNDVRGSVIARTSLTASNPRQFDREAEYDAWGNTVEYGGPALAPRYRFTGEEPDPGTGYYYLGARVYDPTLHRWLSPDPLLHVNLEADASQGMQSNLYAYAANNPVRFTDTSGRFVPLILLAPVVIEAALDTALVASVLLAAVAV